MPKLVTLEGEAAKMPNKASKPLIYLGLGVLIYLLMKEKK